MVTILSREDQFQESQIDSDFEGALKNVWWHLGYIPFGPIATGPRVNADGQLEEA